MNNNMPISNLWKSRLAKLCISPGRLEDLRTCQNFILKANRLMQNNRFHSIPWHWHIYSGEHAITQSTKYSESMLALYCTKVEGGPNSKLFFIYSSNTMLSNRARAYRYLQKENEMFNKCFALDGGGITLSVLHHLPKSPSIVGHSNFLVYSHRNDTQTFWSVASIVPSPSPIV